MKNRMICLGILLLFLVTTACAAKQIVSNEEIQNTADVITEEILVGMNEKNYTKFSGNFDLQMKNNLPEAKFKIISHDIEEKIGSYVSKEYVNTHKKEQSIVVIYKGKFSKDANDVIIRTVLTETEGKLYVSGFWLDSPNLRK